jgi:imidazolonepropionase-like amidohydrolase
MEKLGAIYENAAILNAAGVKIALQTANDHNVRILPYHAGLAVAYGLPRNDALKAVTLYPAQIFGVSDRLGSLERGKQANIAVFSGDPFEPLTRLEHLFIRGQEVDLINKQTILFEKFLQD